MGVRVTTGEAGKSDHSAVMTGTEKAVGMASVMPAPS